ANDVVRLQALIDRNKVIIIEDTIRQALRLDDADRVDCLPNEEIFAELARMGYEAVYQVNILQGNFCAPMEVPHSYNSSVFANIKRIGKGFSGVDTPLFDVMLVQQQAQDVEDAIEDENNDNEVSAEPTPPSPTLALT
nr:hypothetical protein [Tanacetum cinerariifolium]